MYLPDVSVCEGDILEKYRAAGGKKIVCKFMRSDRGSPRDQIYRKRLSLGKDENGQRKSIENQLFISEMLTQGTQNAFSRLRRIKKEGLIHTVFTRQGTIYVRLIEHGEIIAVRGQRDLEQILQDVQRDA